MNKLIFAWIAAAVTGSAVAAPRESVTFSNVDSVGLRGNPLNQVRTATFASSDAGGAYTTRMLTLTGAVFDSFGTSTWAREAVIEVTPPGGQTFVCIPHDAAHYVGFAPIGEGRYTVPIAPVSTPGLWTFRFAETYDDDAAGVDQTWESVTITLDDGQPPPLAAPVGGVTTSFTSIASNGVRGSGSTVVTRTLTNPGAVNRVQIIGRLTVASLVSTDTLTGVPSQARVRVTPPPGSGVSPFDVAPVTSGLSTCLVNAVIDIPGVPTLGVPIAGTWTFEFYESIDEPGAVDAVWQNVTFTLQNTNTPHADSLGELRDGGESVEDSHFRAFPVEAQAGIVRWYTFEAPSEISASSGGSLDIDMVGTQVGPQNDLSMALYSGAGSLIAWSFDEGPGLLPQISVGGGLRPRTSSGLPFDGQNPTLSPQGTTTASIWPPVPAGTNYIAVCSGNDGVQFTPSDWQVAPSTESNGTEASLRLRYYSATPAIPPSDAITLPTLGTVIRGSVTLGSDQGQRAKWLRLTIPQNASIATGRYVDIDTTATLAPTHDTVIALYDSQGYLRGSHNDLNVQGGPTNYTARNSALSFGALSPLRDYRGDWNLPLADGRNGPLEAGTYYLYIGLCCPGFGRDRFWAITDYVTNAGAGQVMWNIYSNFSNPCGLADIAGQGGILGRDNRLDNNDYVVFIEQYFLMSPIADFGMQGGIATPDGNFDNNDFVVFIDHYFAAPTSCR